MLGVFRYHSYFVLLYSEQSSLNGHNTSDTEPRSDWIQSSRNDMGDQVPPTSSLCVQKQNWVLQPVYVQGGKTLCFSLLRDQNKSNLMTVSWRLLEVGPAHPFPTPAVGWLPPTSSGCPGPHPTRPWAPPGMGTHSSMGSCARASLPSE